jgi:cobalt-zinc-cadmium efflux system protein
VTAVPAPAPAPDSRAQRLRDAGFTYDERLDVWFNVEAGRALRGATMRANTETWLVAWLAGHQQVNRNSIATYGPFLRHFGSLSIGSLAGTSTTTSSGRRTWRAATLERRRKGRSRPTAETSSFLFPDTPAAMTTTTHEHVSPRLVVTALAITVVAAAVELVGARRGNTLFLVADAFHLLAHVGIFIVLLVPTGRRHEWTEDLAATAILCMVAIIALGIAGTSIHRVISESTEPPEPLMMLLSLVGLAANLITAWLFADPAQRRWSFRAALAHELADGGLTVAGLVGAGLIAVLGWGWIDPTLSFAIALWLGAWSGRLLLRRIRLGSGVWALERPG